MSEESERLAIQLTDYHVLSADTHNWIIIYTKPTINPKTGEPTSNSKKTFHPTIASAVRSVIDHCTKESELTSLKELIKFQTELSDKLVQVLAEYDAETEE